MEAKKYRKILNPGEMSHHRSSPFHQSEDVLIVESGSLHASCRKSDIFKFIGLVFLVCAISFGLSMYRLSDTSFMEQSKENLIERESLMYSLYPEREKKSECSQEKVEGNCRAIIPRWYYDSEKDVCSQFNYSGCNGTANNFESQEECASSCIAHQISEEQDICTFSPDSGPCRGSIIRFSYNHESRLCEKFLYGGCGGNENNFPSVRECLDKCEVSRSPSSSDGRDSCSLAPERGPCRGNIPRWYFSKSDNICKRFIFGGCLPNKNNFLNEMDCLAKCGERMSHKYDECTLPIDSGTCKSIFPKFAFDYAAKNCVAFNYSGCEGNANRYDTLEDCEKNCQRMIMDTQGDDIEEVNESKERKLQDCKSDPDRGRCRGYFTRYYFDGSECKTFIFGGCLGNANNFESEAQCLSACSGDQLGNRSN